MTVCTVGSVEVVMAGHELPNNCWINFPVPNKRILSILLSRRYKIIATNKQMAMKTSLYHVKKLQVYVVLSLIVYKHEVVYETVF